MDVRQALPAAQVLAQRRRASHEPYMGDVETQRLDGDPGDHALGHRNLGCIVVCTVHSLVAVGVWPQQGVVADGEFESIWVFEAGD